MVPHLETFDDRSFQPFDELDVGYAKKLVTRRSILTETFQCNAETCYIDGICAFIGIRGAATAGHARKHGKSRTSIWGTATGTLIAGGF